MKLILSVVGFILLISIILLFGTDNSNDNSSNQIDFSSYQSSDNDEYQYSFDYPTEATISTESGRTKVVFAGPNNEDPALTDGFSWSMGLISYNDVSDLTAEAIDIVNESVHNQNKTYSFIATNELGGNSNYYVTVLDDDTAAEIVFTIKGDSADYQSLVDRMNNSISFDRTAFQNPDDTTSSLVDKISIALLTDPEGSPERGCDDVVMVERTIDPTPAPLNSAISALFDIDETTIEGYRHFIPKTTSTLSFDRAEIVDNEAQIYLTGELSGLTGVCDNPRAAIQIEETALQFSTIDTVQIYLNEQPTDLIPGQQN